MLVNNVHIECSRADKDIRGWILIIRKLPNAFEAMLAINKL